MSTTLPSTVVAAQNAAATSVQPGNMAPPVPVIGDGAAAVAAAAPAAPPDNAVRDTLSTGCASISTFTNSAPPPACWTPYASSSVWNQRLVSSPRYASNSQSAVDYYFSNFSRQMGPTEVSHPFDSAHDYGMPYYFGRSSDPQVTIHCYGYGGTACGQRVHIPKNALSERGSCCNGDQHMTVVDLTNDNEYDLYQWTTAPPYYNGESVRVNAGNMGNVSSGNGFWECSGANAGCTGLLGGVVFLSELQAGTINHKLALALPCTAYTQGVYPVHGGSYQRCSAGGSSTGNTEPIGSVLYWDESSSQVATRNITPSAKAVLNALHAYGGIVTDTNGNSGSLSITNAPESQTRYVSAAGSDLVGSYGASNFDQLWPSHYAIDLSEVSPSEVKTHLHVLSVCVVQGSC